MRIRTTTLMREQRLLDVEASFLCEWRLASELEGKMVCWETLKAGGCGRGFNDGDQNKW